MTHQNISALTLPKRARGRTAIDATPIVTRSRVSLPAVTRRSIEERLRGTLAPFGPSIERASVRFEDLNGPRGGVDIHCTIEIVLSGSNSIIIEQRAPGVLAATRRALPRVARTVRKYADRRGRKTPRATLAPRTAAPRKSTEGPARSKAARDTGSITRKRAGGASSARRNNRFETSGMTYALEDSRGKPSRKSTRGSAGRSKAATQLTRRNQRKLRSPQARAARAAG